MSATARAWSAPWPCQLTADSSPTVGLLDQPQDACFYDWHLIDAKDEPYASFRFHYRSWKSLEQLSLIPHKELGIMQSMSSLSINQPSTATRASPSSPSRSPNTPRRKATPKLTLPNSSGVAHEEGPECPLLPPPSLPNFSLSDEALLEYGDTQDDTDSYYNGTEQFLDFYFTSPPELQSARTAPAPTPPIPQPSKAVRDAYRDSYLQRPLPEIPGGDKKKHRSTAALLATIPLPPIPADGGLATVRRASSSSTVSAVSLAPSLAQYVEGGSIDGDSVEVGIARAVDLSNKSESINAAAAAALPEGRLAEEDEEEEQEGDYSMSDYGAASPPSTVGSPARGPGGVVSPRHYLATVGTCFEEENTGVRFDMESDAAVLGRVAGGGGGGRGGGGGSETEVSAGADRELGRPSTVSLSESEWMSSRTWSMASLEDAGCFGRAGASSSRGKKVNGPSLFSRLHRRKLSGSPVKMMLK